MTILTMLCFSGLLILCVAGLFNDGYQDNWLQHLGLIGMGIASAAAIHKVHYMEWVPPEMVLFSVAALLFGCGTACKVWVHRHANQRERRSHAHKTL